MIGSIMLIAGQLALIVFLAYALIYREVPLANKEMVLMLLTNTTGNITMIIGSIFNFGQPHNAKQPVTMTGDVDTQVIQTGDKT